MTRASTRQSLLTNNLANVNTPGYKRKDISFNITIAEEQKKLGSLGSNNGIETDESSIRVDGNNVDMEKEVMGLAETELRYNALTSMTAAYFSNLKNVINGGK